MKNFYLHVSQAISVPAEKIIGIFDMDSSTVSGETRSFLRLSQSKNDLISDVMDIPKAFVVTPEKIYLSQLSSHTLAGRLND